MAKQNSTARQDRKADVAASHLLTENDGRELAAAMLALARSRDIMDQSIDPSERPRKPQLNTVLPFLQRIHQANNPALDAGFSAVLTDVIAGFAHAAMREPNFYQQGDLFSSEGLSFGFRSAGSPVISVNCMPTRKRPRRSVGVFNDIGALLQKTARAAESKPVVRRRRTPNAASEVDALRERLRASLDRSDRAEMISSLRNPSKLPLHFEDCLSERSSDRARFIDAAVFREVLDALRGDRNAVRRAARIVRFLDWVRSNRPLIHAHTLDEVTRRHRGRTKREPFVLNLPGISIGPGIPRHTPHLWAACINPKDVANAGGGKDEGKWRGILVHSLNELLPERDKYALIAALLTCAGAARVTRQLVAAILASRRRT